MSTSLLHQHLQICPHVACSLHTEVLERDAFHFHHGLWGKRRLCLCLYHCSYPSIHIVPIVTTLITLVPTILIHFNSHTRHTSRPTTPSSLKRVVVHPVALVLQYFGSSLGIRHWYWDFISKTSTNSGIKCFSSVQ